MAIALEYAKERVDRDLSTFRESAERMQSDADRFTKGLRSGNPALRAAAEAANPRAIRDGLDELAETIGKVAKYSKIIPVAGGVIDVVAAGVEIAEGASPSSVGVGFLGGLAGGAGAGAIAAGAAAPPVAVAVGVVFGSVFVGDRGRWLYEAWVPIDVRESIDDFFVGAPPTLVREPVTGTTGRSLR